MAQLLDAMSRREPDTFEADLAHLKQAMASARVPAGMLGVKIREMREGTFNKVPSVLLGGNSTNPATGLASSSLTDAMREDILALVKEYNFDARISDRLATTMAKRSATFSEDMATLRDVLPTARNPAGLLCVKLGDMDNGTFAPRDDKARKFVWESKEGDPSQQDPGFGSKEGAQSRKESADDEAIRRLREGAEKAVGITRTIARPGDWNCPSCNELVFASRDTCRKCGAAKPKKGRSRSRRRSRSKGRSRSRKRSRDRRRSRSRKRSRTRRSHSKKRSRSVRTISSS